MTTTAADPSGEATARFAGVAAFCFDLGGSVPLGHCVYGPASFDPSGFANRTPPYYRFLAGFARFTGARNVVEIGTHYGGSALAIDAGLASLGEGFDYAVTTVDVVDRGNPRLPAHPRVRPMLLDVLSPEGRARLDEALRPRGPVIDLLYIDALKDRDFLLGAIEHFTRGYLVRHIVLDDIMISGSIRRAWDELVAFYGADAIALHDAAPQIRQPNVGFGLLSTAGRAAFAPAPAA